LFNSFLTMAKFTSWRAVSLQFQAGHCHGGHLRGHTPCSAIVAFFSELSVHGQFGAWGTPGKGAKAGE
jgi:hypothetical protein